MTDHKIAMLTPVWDCRTPASLNDFDLQPEMKDPPVVQERSSEAVFAVVRSEIGEFVRHSTFHLDFVSPALKSVAKDVQGGHVPEGGEMVALEKMIEDNYLDFCNPENSLQFMTIWTARGYLAKNRLLEHYSKYPRSSVQQTDVQRDAAVSHALSMLECDTNLKISSLTTKYHWFVEFHFPFLAYLHIVQDLRLRPFSDHAEKSWEIMSDNYEARYIVPGQKDNPFFSMFTKLILQAWEAREGVIRPSSTPLVPPRIVSDIKQIMARTTQDAHDAYINQANNVFGMNTDFSMSMPGDSGSHSLIHGMGGQGYVGSESIPNHSIPGQAALDDGLNDLDWTSMDWNTLYRW